MEEPVNQSLTGRACLVYALAVVLGVALAWAVAPSLFRALPTDMSRIQVILDALADTDNAPEIVLFGSSVGMASVDMREVTAALDDKPLGYNLASTGQTPVEAYMFYQQLPDATRLVIQLLNPSTLAHAGVLDEQKYNALYMYGYRPDDRTVERTSALLGSDMAALYERSDLAQRFDSRWAVRQMADRFARGLLRKDLTLDKGTYDLFYPSSYTTRLPDAQFERALQDKFGKDNLLNNYYPDKGKFGLLAELNARAQEAGKQVIFVMQPQHPAAYRYRGRGYFEEARQALATFAKENNAIVLDATDTIPGDMFVDAVHPSAAGAGQFTAWLVAELKRLRATGSLPL